ncbi:MAG: xanthine dehydrogenase family protein subunit M [Actinomycetota bacterium]
MKSAGFTYHRPSTVDGALALLAEHGDEAKILAGGQSLLPMMGLRLARPTHLVDINGLDADLDFIAAGPDGLRIGALVRHANAEHHPAVAEHGPMIAAALPLVGHRPIRTRGTVVGSIAHGDPAAEMPAVCVATDATLVARSAAGTRELPAATFFEGYLGTGLRDDELLAEVRFPAWAPTSGGAVVEIARRHGDYALVGLACRVDVLDGIIDDAALVFLGVGGTPVRVTAAEDSLRGQAPSEALFAEAGRIVSTTLDAGSDLHASAAYRRHIAGVLTNQGLAEATSRIGVTA